VGDLDALRQPRHASRQQAETRTPAVLVPFLEEKLHAEADAEHRDTPGDGLVQRYPEWRSALHPQAEGCNPWKNHPGRLGERGRVGHQRRLSAGAPERLEHGAQIAETEIDHRDVHSTPLVLGTTPERRPSSATACGSARANDLNTASAP